MSRPCGHPDSELPMVGRPWDTKQCRLCFLYANDPAYKALWDGQPLPMATQPTFSCVHLGGPLGTIECPSCGGNVKAKISVCDIHDKCTLFSKPIPGVKSCNGCPDHAVAEG